MAGSSNGGTSGGTNSSGTGEVVLLDAPRGIAVIGASTELKGLHYFDGKFLRAQDMQTEQAFLRFLAALAAQGGGAGVVYGYDVTSADAASVLVKQGLAFDAGGRPLYLTVDQRLDLGALVAATQASDPGASGSPIRSSDFADCTVALAAGTVPTAPGSDLYLLTVGFLEALCGEEDVFGKLCEDACVDAKNRRFVLDGVIFRAVPLVGLGGLPTSQKVTLGPQHYRSRVASAFFDAERKAVSPQITGAGIQDGVFCLGARQLVGDGVPIAVFSRTGNTTAFVDAWIGRRERIEPPNRRYWAWRMSMRPWDVFLAQIFQFQCQLKDALMGVVTGGGGDPCAPKTAVIGQARELVSRVEAWYAGVATTLGADGMKALPVQPFQLAELSRLKAALAGVASPTSPQGARLLIDGGIVELPSAGYLPVSVGSPTVNQQVLDLMGAGVDLRFCICRPDFVPHVLEQAQHMERISLLEGLEDPARVPRVDVFVPDGQVARSVDASSRWFDATLFDNVRFGVSGAGAGRTPSPRSVLRAIASMARSTTEAPQNASVYQPPPFKGAARWAPYGDGGHELYWAGTRLVGQPASDVEPAASWIEASVDRDPFSLGGPPAWAQIYARVIELRPGTEEDFVTLELANLRFTADAPAVPGNEMMIQGRIEGSAVPLHWPSTGGDGGSPYFSLNVRLRRVVTATGGQITVEPMVQGSATFRWEWIAGTPLTGALHVNVTRTDTSGEAPDLIVYQVREDPDARNPSNPFHGLSEIAIPAIQRQVATAPFNLRGFGTYAEEALFPPPSATPSLDVTATLDWVLFARRRECSCGAAGVAPAQDEKFRVWRLDVDALSEDQRKSFPTTLVSTEPADIDFVKRVVKPVGVVAFPATGSSLRDVAAAVNDAKAALGAATILVGGVIGQQPPQDPPTLEAARLQSYAAALLGLLTRDPNAEFKTLPIMPPALADPNVSGAIVIAATQASEMEELVFRVSPENAGPFAEQLKAVLSGDKVSTLFQPIPNGLSVLVGVARFDAGNSTLQPDSEDLAAGWANAGGGDVASAQAIVDPKETEPIATIAHRTDAIVASLPVAPGSNLQPAMLKPGSWDLGLGTGTAFANARSAVYLVAKPAQINRDVARAPSAGVRRPHRARKGRR